MARRDMSMNEAEIAELLAAAHNLQVATNSSFSAVGRTSTVMLVKRDARYQTMDEFQAALLDPVLARLDLTLASWTRRGFDTRTRDADVVSARLLRGLADGDILLLHDGHAARGAGDRPVILDALPQVLEAVGRAGLRPVTLQAALDLP